MPRIKSHGYSAPSGRRPGSRAYDPCGRLAHDEVEAAMLLVAKARKKQQRKEQEPQDKRRRCKPTVSLARMPWDDREEE